jgi:hypothetical protein
MKKILFLIITMLCLTLTSLSQNIYNFYADSNYLKANIDVQKKYFSYYNNELTKASDEEKKIVDVMKFDKWYSALLHRKYNTFIYVASDRIKKISYKEWLYQNKFVDNYVEPINIELRAIFLNDSINTPKEGYIFFDNAIKAVNNKQYTEAIRYFTYAINTNINFALAYYGRALVKIELNMHGEEIIPDMIMACNLGVSDACITLVKIRNRQKFTHFLFYNTFFK